MEASSKNPPSGEGEAPLFSAVQRDERLSDKVAAQIRATIEERKLSPGDRLPSERMLGEQFGVSRTVIREAVRSLAAKGLVESGGRGMRIATVGSQNVAESMMLYLAGQPTSYAKVSEVRSMIEIEVARLAAERATADDVAQLEALCERLAAADAESGEAATADVEFHRVLARATHNELYLIMLDSMFEPLLDARRTTMSIPGRAEKGAEAHRRILAAVKAGDPAAAVEAMREHLDDSLRLWTELADNEDG